MKYTLVMHSYPVQYSLIRDGMTGGHTYASIEGGHLATPHPLERVIDAPYRLALRRIGDDYGYLNGLTTTRLTSEAEAYALAIEWMKQNAPNGELVDDFSFSEQSVIYPIPKELND